MSGGTGRRRWSSDIKLTGLTWLSSVGRVLGHRDHAAGRIERTQGPPGGVVNMHPRRRWQLRPEVGARPIEPAITDDDPAGTQDGSLVFLDSGSAICKCQAKRGPRR